MARLTRLGASVAAQRQAKELRRRRLRAELSQPGVIQAEVARLTSINGSPNRNSARPVGAIEVTLKGFVGD